MGLYDAVTLKAGTDGFKLTVSGEGQGKLDKAPAKSLACRSVAAFYQRIGEPLPALDIHMDNRIPLSRGLGSSAAAIVGALVAANAYSGANLNRDALFDLAVEMEGHADNVAAAIYGGLTISYKQGDRFKVRHLIPDADIRVALMVPQTGLSTAEARAVLGPQVARSEAVFNISRVSLLIEALLTGELSLMATAVEDTLHQPGRRGLIEDYGAVESAAYRAGAKGVALSGAGPTLIAFYDKSDEVAFRAAVTEELTSAGVERRPLFLGIDADGAEVVSV